MTAVDYSPTIIVESFAAAVIRHIFICCHFFCCKWFCAPRATFWRYGVWSLAFLTVNATCIGLLLFPDTNIGQHSRKSSSPDPFVENFNDHSGMIKPPNICITLLIYIHRLYIHYLYIHCVAHLSLHWYANSTINSICRSSYFWCQPWWCLQHCFQNNKSYIQRYKLKIS